MNLCARSPVLLLVRTGLLVSLLPAVLATCRLDDLVSSPDDPALELQVSGVVVGVADSAQLSPTVLVDGVARDDLQLAWSTTDSSIATIDPAGFVRGHARGRAVVTARLDAGTVGSSDVEASDTVWVVAASLELAPGDTTLTSAGDTVCLRHIARDARGIPLTGTSPTFSVSGDPDSTVTLTQPGGCAVGRTSGRAATLTATLDTATASATITVSQTVAALSIRPDTTELLNLGDTVRLTADARDRRGEPVPPTLVEWSNSDSAVAVVDSQGVVTAQGAGATVVRGTANGITDSAIILVDLPDAPQAPQTLQQQRSDSSTAISVGTTTDQDVVVLRATVSDPDLGETLQLQVEVKPVSSQFTGTATATSDWVASGSDAAVRVSGLSENAMYHWQARAFDQTGRPGAWVSFGGNSESEVDFAVNTAPEAPSEPRDRGQFTSDGTLAIPLGGITNEDQVRLKATVTDPDPGDQVRLQVEVKPVDTDWTGSPTLTSLPVASGGVAVVLWGPLADGLYHWRARTVDGDSNSSAWVSFGGNQDTPLPAATDFQVDVP